MNKIILTLAITVLFSTNIFAQETTITIPEDVKNQIIEQATKQMQDSPFNDFIDFDMKCMLNEILENPMGIEKLAKDFQVVQEHFMTIYPNPSKGTDVTVEFLQDWPLIKCKKPVVKSLAKAELKLFYNNKLITKLDDFQVADNKFTIPANLIKEEGSYTISNGNDLSVSFLVTK